MFLQGPLQLGGLHEDPAGGRVLPGPGQQPPANFRVLPSKEISVIA